MIVLNHKERVDEPRTTTLHQDDPMYWVIDGSQRKEQFVIGDWEVKGHDPIVVHHYHRAFGNSRLKVQLWEMEIAGILHCMFPRNILEAKIQQELRQALGEESHVFHWVGWEIAALMDSMDAWQTDYLREIKDHFLNCIGRDLASMYVGLAAN